MHVFWGKKSGFYELIKSLLKYRLNFPSVVCVTLRHLIKWVVRFLCFWHTVSIPIKKHSRVCVSFLASVMTVGFFFYERLCHAIQHLSYVLTVSGFVDDNDTTYQLIILASHLETDVYFTTSLWSSFLWHYGIMDSMLFWFGNRVSPMR